MRKFLCFLGMHKYESKKKPANDGGTLYWDKCIHCNKETEAMCVHSFGPFKVTL